MGLVTYVTGDYGAETFRGLDGGRSRIWSAADRSKLSVHLAGAAEAARPPRPDEYWKVLRSRARQPRLPVMMSCPDMRAPALPDFVLERVPMVRLEGEWKRKGRESASYEEPRYDHPYFQEAFRELNALLAAELDGSPLVEYFDTFMYGFWGEGHTWPLTNHPFPDDAAAERTFVRMFEVQLEHWKKTPLATNTQPDFSRVGIRARGSHSPQPQLAPHRHGLHRERADRSAEQPAPWSPRSSRFRCPTGRRTRSSSTRA
jgi:hypothetical protein